MTGITIQIKRGSNIGANDTSLRQGEIGIDLAQGDIKVGKTATPWKDLDAIRFPLKVLLADQTKEYYLQERGNNSLRWELLNDPSTGTRVPHRDLSIGNGLTGIPTVQPAATAEGMQVVRGLYPTACLFFDEETTTWYAGQLSSYSKILTKTNHLDLDDPHPDQYLQTIYNGGETAERAVLFSTFNTRWEVASDVLVADPGEITV